MPTVTMYKTDGASAGEIQLADQIFGQEVNVSAIHQVVVAQLAAKRQGTQSALGRSEVRGGGIKPWRQKGTGRARQGSIRAPQWTKGGVVFAPKPRSYSQKVNKKIRRIALFSALSMKVKDEDIIVLENFDLEAPKTKEVVKVLGNLKVAGKKALIVTAGNTEDVVRGARNIPVVKTAMAGALSVYDLMNCEKLIVTRDAVKQIEEVYA